MEEILPDVILMPNAGTRAMMWQETASVRNDTPARFMIPIFTAVDLQEAILENCDLLECAERSRVCAGMISANGR